MSIGCSWLTGGTDKGYKPTESAERLGGDIESYIRSGGVVPQIEGYRTIDKGFDLSGRTSKARALVDRYQRGEATAADMQELVDAGYIQPIYKEQTPVQETFKFSPYETEGGKMLLALGQNLPEYQQVQYIPQELTFGQIADPAYRAAEERAVEGAKRGTLAAMQQAAGMLGRRGVGAGGIGQMTMGRAAEAAGRDIADIRGQMGLQRARELSDLQRQQQLAQAQQRQFGAQFLSGQRQFSADLGERRRAAQAQRILGSEALGQQYRKEKYGYQRQPVEDMMKLYGIQASAAARSDKDKGVASDIGQIAAGIGTGMSYF